ncbi:MAG: choice-of-anchor tandem repeat GloVer-containing protein [Candidatus Cybelea sp.]
MLPDGNEPAAGLIDVDGTLYGTTAWGGGYGHGAAFSITSSGTEKVLHSFGKGTDGYYPQAGLIDVGGTLYGTTEYGGSGSCSNDFYHGCGTVFSITTGGKEKVLHSFSDAGAQGSNPLAGLIDVGGALYGTTFQGGYGGRGTVFRITTGGTEKVLHNFGLGTDGCYPLAALVDVGGTLYGTTYSGGMYGVGTAFSITTSGVEKVLHSFGNGSDGVFPVAGLIKVNETLYSTTYNGGLHNAGTVFALTP